MPPIGVPQGVGAAGGTGKAGRVPAASTPRPRPAAVFAEDPSQFIRGSAGISRILRNSDSFLALTWLTTTFQRSFSPVQKT
jgi:hypothetical protein